MSSKNSKLLIVDDEPATRLLLSQIFAELGHEVVCAEDGFSALRQIKHCLPDVILSDLNMPGMSGFEFLSVIRRRLPAIYVIASSGAYSGTEVPEGIAADAFYEKATGLKALFELVDTAKGLQPLGVRSANPSVPIWISLGDGSAESESSLSIVCPDCLRVFVRPCPPENASSLIHEDHCVHCKACIQYAVVRVLGAVSEKVYQSQLDTQIAMGA
jgi:CheY-like chemotaxis protein